MDHVAQLRRRGLEVAAGGVEARVAQQLLDLDDRRAPVSRAWVVKVWRRACTRAPAGLWAPSPALRSSMAMVYRTAERIMALPSWPTNTGAPQAAGLRRGKRCLREAR